MTRTMYDSVSPGSIPAGATLVAGYADGLYANLPAMRARFPHATVVSIAVRPTTRAQVLDVETGDATPAQAVTWCRQTMADTPNGRLTIYCNTSTWPAVQAAFASAGEPRPNYWVANYDGSPSIPAGAIAKQFRNTSGWDESVVADYWPGVDPIPAPPPVPTPTPEPDMPLTSDDINAVAAAVWNYQVPDWGLDASGNAVALGTSKAVFWHAVWNDVDAAKERAMFAQVLAAISASKLTPAEIAAALADGTLHVQLSVTAGP